MNSTRYKVGDKIVDFGRVYNIFKVEGNRKNDTDIIHFRPYFKSKKDGGMTCSIPVKSLEKTNIRRPINEKRMKKILTLLASKADDTLNLVETTDAKEVLGVNKAGKTAKILKSLWLEKQDETKNFTRSKESAFKHLVERLSEEIAYAGHISLKTAEIKIRRALKRSAL